MERNNSLFLHEFVLVDQYPYDTARYDFCARLALEGENFAMHLHSFCIFVILLSRSHVTALSIKRFNMK